MSGEHPEYNTRKFSPIREKFSRVIQGPSPNYITDNYAIQRKENSQTIAQALDTNSQPSVIQGIFRKNKTMNEPNPISRPIQKS